jgi:hypothetical protein
MSKFISVVKFNVKEGKEPDFLDSMKKFSNPEGVIFRKILKTGDRSYCSIVEWVNEQSQCICLCIDLATLSLQFLLGLQDLHVCKQKSQYFLKDKQ